MSSAIIKKDIGELISSFSVLIKNVDERLVMEKEKNKGKKIWNEYKNYKSFLKKIESESIKKTCEELNMGETTIREYFKTFTLPLPIFQAIEDDDISFSKAKILTSINFDFENDNDIQVAEDIVEEIIDKTDKEIKAVVKRNSMRVWNQKDIVMRRLAEQNGITEDAIC